MWKIPYSLQANFRYCNKNCETLAHSKERESKVSANENPVDDSGNSFEKAIEAEIKRDAKRKRRGQRNLKFAMQDSESAFLNPDQFKALRQIASSANTPRPRNGQRQEDVRVPTTPEDQN